MNFSAPWHKASYDRFLRERLPELLATVLPLAGYIAEDNDPYTCLITISVALEDRVVLLTYPDFPRPDENGLFFIDGQPYVVIPVASQEELDRASIDCVGEQLAAYLTARLARLREGEGYPPFEEANLEELLRTWLPLSEYARAFLHQYAQPLDTTNWFSRHTHLRRILIPSRRKVVAAGQTGRVDPFETPEGPNIGKVFSIAAGAEIREGKLVIVEDAPQAALGTTSLMIPLLEHNDPNHLLMAVNMMRQSLPSPDPEPALVQTGLEPTDAGGDFWTGKNLLTAFVSLGEATTERGIVLSQSAARRLNYPYEAEVGDKLSNRHGTKGVVSAVLPDEQMPHLPDGRPVELVYSFHALHTHLNFGQILEAVLGNVAQIEGKPVIAPSFAGPTRQELRDLLQHAGLDAEGMVKLRQGKNGSEMPFPSTVGPVYWYRLMHLARGKLHVVAVPAPEAAFRGQKFGQMEIEQLLAAGAIENARAVQQGNTDPSARPASYFSRLAAQLRRVGIEARLEDGQLIFQFAEPHGEGFSLARPLAHPWLPERCIQTIAAPDPEGDRQAVEAQLAAWNTLIETNHRLERVIAAGAPQRLVEEAEKTLAARLGEYFDLLVSPAALPVGRWLPFSGRSVISPGIDLRSDQVGLPDDMISTLFGPLAQGKDLEEFLARKWVLVNRAPTLAPTNLLAFHPVRAAGSAIRLHPLACKALNADFDGDLVAVYVLLSEAAQREAGQRLTLAAHLRRDSTLTAENGLFLPPPDALWGLAYHSLSEEGRQEIDTILKAGPVSPKRMLTPLALVRGLQNLLAREGAEAVIETLQLLCTLGYRSAARSGASLSAFAGTDIALPPAPAGSDAGTWQDYLETVSEIIAAGSDDADPLIGPQRLLARLGLGRRHLSLLLAPRGPASQAGLVAVDGEDVRLSASDMGEVILRHSLVEGWNPEEMMAGVAASRLGFAQLAFQGERILANQDVAGDLGVLARARRARRPGVVFARAAASGEVDALEDPVSRILIQ